MDLLDPISRRLRLELGHQVSILQPWMDPGKYSHTVYDSAEKDTKTCTEDEQRAFVTCLSKLAWLSHQGFLHLPQDSTMISYRTTLLHPRKSLSLCPTLFLAGPELGAVIYYRTNLTCHPLLTVYGI